MQEISKIKQNENTCGSFHGKKPSEPKKEAKGYSTHPLVLEFFLALWQSQQLEGVILIHGFISSCISSDHSSLCSSDTASS
jgi:hypothetical protein